MPVSGTLSDIKKVSKVLHTASNGDDILPTDAVLLHALQGHDLILGSLRNQTLFGDQGNDIINGGGGSDTLDGGLGIDWVTFQSLPGGNPYSGGVTVDLSKTTYKYSGGSGKAVNFENVWGSDGADTITGDSNANVLLGGAANDVISGGSGDDTLDGGTGNDVLNGGTGNDLIYGSAGGNDSVDGGAGIDTISFGAAPFVSYPGSPTYPVYLDCVIGLSVNLAGGIYSYEAWSGTVVGIENVIGSDCPDTIIGHNGANQLSGGDENDILNGGGGGGDVIDGGNGSDWISFRPLGVAPEQNPYAGGVTVNLQSTSVAGTGSFSASGASGTLSNIENVWGSDGADHIAGSSAANVLLGGGGNDYINGRDGNDIIYGGPSSGYNILLSQTGDVLTGGAGNDVFYVGYDYNPMRLVSSAPAPGAGVYGNPTTSIVGQTEVTASAVITDWANSVDTLNVSASSVAVIGGLYGNTDWAGNDTVDLRTGVANAGTVVVSTGGGNDTIYGSAGKDWIRGGAGLNNIQLGGTDAAGDGQADRVYIDSFMGQYNISGFESSDTIYLDQRIIQNFLNSTGIQTPTMTYGTAVKSGTVTSGQAYNNGWFPTSELVYDASYNGILSVYTSNGFVGRDPDQTSVLGQGVNGPLNYGWYSNGAWSNSAHDSAHSVARPAVIAGGAVSLYIGNALSAIPFVGPILAIPFWVNGAFMLNDGINNVAPHQNAEYQGAILDYSVNMLSSSRSPSSAVASWDARQFLDFYNIPSDQFTPSLQVTSQPVDKGICSFVTVFNGTETFIYLAFSQDGIIQNNETRLIAQVNGQVTADQIKMFNGATDGDYTKYFGGSSDTPVFPPNITSVDVNVSVGKQLINGVTDDSTPDIRITFDKLLTANDVVTVYVGNSAFNISAACLAAQPGTPGAWTYTFTPPSVLGDGAYAITVNISNNQALETSGYGFVGIDTTAPDPAQVTLVSDSTGLTLSTTESGSFQYGLYVGSSPLGTMVDAGSHLDAEAQSDVTISAIRVQDVFGRTTTLPQTLILGTTGSDIDSSALDGTSSSDKNFIYGFGGVDSLLAGQHGDDLYGGDGADTISGGIGNDLVCGGGGADTIDITSGGADTILVGAIAGTSSDSGSGAEDTITGFGLDDSLAIVATNVNDFDPNEIAAVAGNVLTIDLDASGSLTIGDVVLNFDTGTAAANALANASYDLAGTASGDTLIGSTGDDRLAGGAGNDDLTGGDSNDILIGGIGADILTGGSGNDSFVFLAGDSSSDPTTCDVIADLSAGDKIDLSAISSIVNFDSGSTYTAIGDMTFTAGYDAFVYSSGGKSYLVYETSAGSAGSAGSLEALQINTTGLTLGSWTSTNGVLSVA